MDRLNLKRPAIAIFASAAAADRVHAHEGEPLAPHDLWTAWSWDPWIVIGLTVSAVLYWRGVRPVWSGARPGRGIRLWEVYCFIGGWIALFVGLVSPMHPAGEVLFSAHMLQHEVLMLIAAPLLVLGRPMIPFLWGLPSSWRRTAGALVKPCWIRWSWDTFTSPFTAWWVHAVALWAWHVPFLFEATLQSDLIHSLQHLSFLISALLFWWALLRRSDAGMGYGAAVLYVFTTAVHSSILGALLTFSSIVWYPAYGATTAVWGLTPLEDQQLGGLIMWVPGGVVFVAAGLALLWAWISESERQVLAGEESARLASAKGEI